MCALFAARIGKPKGSRNRKTLARLQEAASHAATSQASSPTPSFSVTPSPYSVSPHSLPTVPEWINSEYPFPSTQPDSYTSYAWMPPQSIPTPPESIDMTLKPIAAHDHTFNRISQSSEFHLHSPQLSRSANTTNTDFSITTHETTSYPVSWQSATCDCFHWQVLNLTSLHMPSTFDESLQCIAATLAACQRTVECQSCEKNSSIVLFLITSLQMVLDRLGALLSKELKATASAPSSSSSSSSFSSASESVMVQYPQAEQQNVMRLLQLRHMLFKTQNALKDIREAILMPRQSPSSDSGLFSFIGVIPGASGYPDCLHQVLDKIQAGLDVLLSTISSHHA
ncbi:hypothetical protein UA08_01622 [Talaromyces atroroseus]|uniref:Aflatoxin regulatory protein domain-containing protein n=1 Tax=Talaromyces atroroseus TaxID=1441469 RepID=A0A1Q5QB12_TALAT|nr:hypothetical protein UA08_01622 [Talaromyces atroroseus]OKL63133.1 hypothetical protein UA08_01622 [Talaromyces atroroseus]